jgi:hypothetical protein
MSVVALISICLINIDGQSAKNRNPGFDFSGIEKFWEIVDILEKDIEPTEAQWSTLFETPGHAEIFRRGEFSREYFQDAIASVFMPSKEGLSEEIIKKHKEGGGFYSWYTPGVIDGYRQAKRDRKWIEARVHELRTYPYLEKATEIALQYLPEDKAEGYPQVAFIIFSDSRGYTPIIIGITGKDDLSSSERECLRSQGLDEHSPFLLLMAHEAFHLYRDRKLEFVEPEQNTPDSRVIWTLNQIENEGIGDLINRKTLFYGDGCLAHTEKARKYQKEQEAQPAILRIMDAILTEMAGDSDIASQLGGTFRGVVPQSGHPTGFYMANVIVDQFGTQAVVDVVRSPFKFFYLYNRAAKKSGDSPVFSTEAISYIKKLEAKYARTE